MIRLATFALAAACAATTLPAAAQFAKPEDAIKYRQSALFVMSQHFGRLGAMANGRAPYDAAAAAANAEVVADMVVTAEAPDPARPSDPDPTDKRDADDIHQSWGYRSLNEFAVTLTDRDRPDDRLALIMVRYGVFEWKLAAVDLQSVRAE